MNPRVFMYGLWCLAMVLGALASSYYAYSPFADGSRSGSAHFYGPTHK